MCDVEKRKRKKKTHCVTFIAQHSLWLGATETERENGVAWIYAKVDDASRSASEEFRGILANFNLSALHSIDVM